MSSVLEAHIIKKLHQLSEFRQAEVLDFVDFLVAKNSQDKSLTNSNEQFDPMRFSGTIDWPVDGLTYQENMRKEWE